MPAPHPSSRSPRSTVDRQMASRREQILEAARAVIERDGYAGLSMRSLASKSGVTVPTIYNLIGNKEAVLFAAVEEQTQGFLASLERAPRDLAAVIDATVRHLTRRPRYYRALLLTLAASDVAHDARQLVSRAVERQIAACLRTLRERGALESWIDERALTQRLQAGLDAAALEWARGALTTPGFRAAANYAAALSMLGAARGEARSAFEATAREHQPRAGRRSRSGPAAPKEGHAA